MCSIKRDKVTQKMTSTVTGDPVGNDRQSYRQPLLNKCFNCFGTVQCNKKMIHQGFNQQYYIGRTQIII